MSKFKEYIGEFEEILNNIRMECNEYIKEMDYGKFLYRGVKKSVKDYKYIVPRKNRRPSDMPIEVHNLLNKSFKKKFGWECRNGVFASGYRKIKGSYGQQYMFFPVNGYKYVWAPKITDLWCEFNRFNKVNDEMIEKLVNRYINKHINNIYTEEIVFKCKGYYLVDFKYEEYLEGELWQ